MLGNEKKLGLIAGFAVIIVIGVAASFWLMTPKWEPVLGGTVSEEMNVQVKNSLMEWGIPFKQDEASGHLLVGKELVSEVRQKLSLSGIPSDLQPGLELFDKSEYGMSEFTQRINYQRAIEAEIARTIRGFVEVRTARVHLTIPKESIFKDRQVKPKASVVLQTKNDQAITEDQTRGIAKLVASAVEGMDEANVIVLNENGEMLFGEGRDENGVSKRVSNRNIEQAYKEKAKDLVSGLVQSNNINIAVYAKINHDKVRSIKEQVLPKSKDVSGHIKKKRQQTNTTPSLEKSKNNSNGLVEEEFIFSTEKSEIEYASGQIEKMSVGIVVAKKIDEKLIDDIKSVVIAGLGLQLDRGDIITVVSVEPMIVPSKTLVDEDKFEVLGADLKNNKLQKIKQDSLLLYSAIAGIFVFVLLVIISLLKKPGSNQDIRLSEQERTRLLNETKNWLAMEK
ncbi:Flagellar M-ring protein [Thalassocella blandensis]|nr:Flagellar M-ring protein [Thalassocella blandensis]